MSALFLENHIAQYYNAEYLYLNLKTIVNTSVVIMGRHPFSLYCITGIGAL